MSATQPIGVEPPGGGPPGGGDDVLKRQLDALANGHCDYLTFLNVMKERFRFEPDENWEVLSLLDQYYRRGKISLEVFRAIKNGFAEYILGPQVAGPALQTPATSAPSAVTQPIAAAAAPTVPTLIPATFTGIAAGPSMAAAAAAASKSQRPLPREVRVGDVLRDRYRVEAIVAHGGSGTVLEVSDANRSNLPPIGKRLAVKVPRTPDLRGNFLNQLRHEFQQLQHLSHPNIVRVFDLDRDAGLWFFTMEMLHGVHLKQIVQARNGRALSRAHALAIIRELGSAVAYAHSRDVVHGDINPQNVFITTAGEVRLLGFGAAHKLSSAEPSPEFERASAASDTHRYASCEVFEGNRPDARDDIYSLSCVAYLLFEGNHPYAGSTSIEARASRFRPRRPAGLSYPQWQMLRAGLRTDAAKRPATAQAWIDAMELGAAQRVPTANELIEAPGDGPRRFRLVAAAAAIAALIGVAYWFSMSGDAPTSPPLTGQPAGDNVALPPSPPARKVAAAGAQSPGAQSPGASAAGAPAGNAPAVGAAPPTATNRQRPSPALAASAVAKPTASTAHAAAPAAAAPAHRAAPPAGEPRAANGPARVEMASDTVDVLPSDHAAHVTVSRRGNLHGVTSFTWWTESGTAKPGTDFMPVLPHVEQMQDGESSLVLTVPLPSTVRDRPKGFYVGIESTEGGAQIGPRALTQVTLPPTN